MKEAGSTPPVSASSILAAGAASSPGRTLALSSPQPEPTSPCPQSPQTPPLDPRGDVNGYDGRGEWPDGRFAEHAPRSPGSCLQRRIDSLHPSGSQRSVLTAMVIQGSISALFARS